MLYRCLEKKQVGTIFVSDLEWLDFIVVLLLLCSIVGSTWKFEAWQALIHNLGCILHTSLSRTAITVGGTVRIKWRESCVV